MLVVGFVSDVEERGWWRRSLSGGEEEAEI